MTGEMGSEKPSMRSIGGLPCEAREIRFADQSGGDAPTEPLELQEVEGVDVPEHDGFDLADAAHQQLLQAVIAHVGVGPLGGEAASVDGLSLLTGHALPASGDPRSIVASRRRRIALGVVGQRAEQLDLLGVQGFDVGLAVVEVELRQVGDLPLHMQVKLLRVLEDGEVRPVGADTIRRVDVRLLATSNQDLEKRVATGAFRPELFFP